LYLGGETEHIKEHTGKKKATPQHISTKKGVKKGFHGIECNQSNPSWCNHGFSREKKVHVLNYEENHQGFIAVA